MTREPRDTAVPGSVPRQGRLRDVGLLPTRRRFERRSVVLAVAAVAYALVFALRTVLTDPGDALDLLYVVPIALIALELGVVAGACSALAGAALVVAYGIAHGGLDPVAVCTHSVAFAAVGVIAGRFSDRMREAQESQRLLLRSGMALTQLVALEELPALISEQARQLLGSDRVEVLVEPAGRASPGAADRKRGAAEEFRIEARGVTYGTLRVARPAGMHDDDRAALSILALQAAVATENALLLAGERERVVIDAELRDARVQLHDRATQLRELLARQESERGELAYALQEQAAQMLAAVLLGLAALERELRVADGTPNLQELRGELSSAMGSLRALAFNLKPSSLAIGLRAALEQLAEAARRNGCTVECALDRCEDPDAETATLVYRAIEEALHAAPAPEQLTLTIAERDELVLSVHAAQPIDVAGLSILGARVYLLGGEAHAAGHDLRVAIPMGHPPGPAAGITPQRRAGPAASA